MAAEHGPTHLHVLGSMHSGATLLALLLDLWPEVAALGQLDWLDDAVDRPCTCGAVPRDCERWAPFVADESGPAGLRPRGRPTTRLQLFRFRLGTLLAAAPGPALRLSAPLLSEARALRDVGRRSVALYGAIATQARVRVVVDLSRDTRRFGAIRQAAETSTRAVHLVRDPRGYAASYKRREGWAVERATRQWVANQRQAALALRALSSASRLLLRYEDLCTAPRAALARVAALCGLSSAPTEGPLQLRKSEAHLLGGNPMRYDLDANAIELDDRWRDELTAEEQRTVLDAAGGWFRS